MQLWSGAFSEFQDSVGSDSVFIQVERAFRARYRSLPGEAEQNAWRHSLSAVRDAVAVDDPSDVGLAVEYHLPFSGLRASSL
jgi:hypothetical protein